MCQNPIILSKPQLNVNSKTIQQKLSLTRKWLCTPHPTHHTNSMSGISQLSLTWFWPNFKHWFLWLYWTDFNYHCDFCPGNICPGNICQYQEYLSCYWPDLDETLKEGSWDHFPQMPTVTVTCPGSICPGDICPYQEYLGCLLHRTFWTQSL